ncbi:MAG: hypothetical protein ACE145_09035 [Terriglobia bacterium]
MKYRNAILLMLMVSLLSSLAWAQTNVKEQSARMTLKVKLNYTGAGSVDEKHKLYVLLFDSNPYTAHTLVDRTSATEPAAALSAGTDKVCSIIARQATGTNKRAVTFAKLSVSPVYAMAFYDKSGEYANQGDPPSHVPMGLYGGKPGNPQPIKLDSGKAVEVELTFGDSAATP